MPVLSQRGRNLTTLQAAITRNATSLATVIQQEVVEAAMPDGFREQNTWRGVLYTYATLSAIVQELGQIVVSLGGTLDGGNPDPDPDPDPEIPQEGTDPVNPANVFNASTFEGDSVIGGNATPLPAGEPNDYFPGFASVMGLFMNAADTVTLELAGVTAGTYAVLCAFGASVGGGTFDVTINGGTTFSLNTARGVDTEVHGVEIAEAATFDGATDTIIFVCTVPGQLNLAHIDVV